MSDHSPDGIPASADVLQSPATRAETDGLQQMAGTVVRRAGTSFVGKFFGLGLQYLGQLMLAWFLGPARFGIYSLGLGIHQLIALLAQLGLALGGTRHVAEYRQKRDAARLKGVLLNVATLPLIVGLSMAVPLILGADILADRVFENPEFATVLRIFALAIPLTASFQAMAVTTTGFGVTGPMVSTLYLIPPAANALLVAVLCTIGLGVVGAAFSWLVAAALACGFIWEAARRLYRSVAPPGVRAIRESGRLVRFSLPLLSGDFLWVAMLWVDVLMLGAFVDSSGVGIYRAASQTAVLLTLVPFAVESIFAPMIASMQARQERGQMLELFQLSTRWSLAASLPLYVALAIASPDVLRVYGPEFPAGALPFVVLISGQMVNCACSGVGPLLVMTGHQHKKLVGDVSVMIANVLLNLYLVPRYGILGAAAATSISISGVNLIWLVQTRVVLGMHPFTWSFAKPLIAAVFAAVAGLWAHSLLAPFHFLLIMLGTGIIVAATFAAALLVLGLDDLDRRLIADRWNAMQGRRRGEERRDRERRDVR